VGAVSNYRFLESVWTLTVVLVVALIAWALTGCTEVQCIKPIVQIERPVLPEVASSELEAISWDAFARLRTRDLLLHQYAEQLEVMIREIAEVPE
jgi:hypothetical protein